MAYDIIFNDMNWESPRTPNQFQPDRACQAEVLRHNQAVGSSRRHEHKTSQSSDRAHGHSRQKSMHRPSTPGPVSDASDAIPPPSISPVSPQAAYTHTAQTRTPNNGTATFHSYSQSQPQSQPRNRPPALKLERSFTKKDIGPPLPSPANTTFDLNHAFEPHRPSPITPPSVDKLHSLPTPDAEVSVMEWDDDHVSALSRVKQSFTGIRQKRSNWTLKSPDYQLNATPRPQLPQVSPPRKLSEANFSRPTRPQTSPQRHAVGSQSGPYYERRPSEPVISTISSIRHEQSRRPSAATTLSCDTDKMLPPTPTSASETSLKENEKPISFHAIMKGLVERASRGNLRKEREDNSTSR